MDKNKITSQDFDEEKDNRDSNINQDKKTKSKSNAQKAMPWLIVGIISLLVILTCVLIAYYQVYTSSKKNAQVLEGVYASGYYSMVDNVNNLAVDVSKYSNLSTTSAKLSTLQDMSGDCNYILSGLSVLPINNQNVVATTKFFNQINGLCQAYSKTLATGGKLTQEQELIFDRIGLVLAKIKDNFNKQNGGMYDTNFNFVDAGIFDKSGMNELSASMGDMTNDSIEYPAMIFDGPFSTALESRDVKGLGDKKFTEQEARKYLQDVVYNNRNITLDFEKLTKGDISTFDYKIGVDGKTFFAQVSETGCKLITLSGYAESGDPIMKIEQAKELAKNFTNNIGYQNMNTVWQEVNQNVAYINLAPIVDGVIYYPDLAKVKVDLTAQDIIGLEGLNYAYNHVSRHPEFLTTETEAENLLGFDYEILKTEKAVIRLDSGKEIACWEFIVERIDGTYFYYIDAQTNEIAKTMKLVKIEDSQKLI